VDVVVGKPEGLVAEGQPSTRPQRAKRSYRSPIGSYYRIVLQSDRGFGPPAPTKWPWKPLQSDRG